MEKIWELIETIRKFQPARLDLEMKGWIKIHPISFRQSSPTRSSPFIDISFLCPFFLWNFRTFGAKNKFPKLNLSWVTFLDLCKSNCSSLTYCMDGIFLSLFIIFSIVFCEFTSWYFDGVLHLLWLFQIFTRNSLFLIIAFKIFLKNSGNNYGILQNTVFWWKVLLAVTGLV